MLNKSGIELEIGPAKDGLSALFGVLLYPEPHPDSVQTTSSPLHELRALNNININAIVPIESSIDHVEAKIISPWRPERIPQTYTFISFIIPILSIYAVAIPSSFRCLLHGKIVVKNTITVVTSFIAFIFSLRFINFLLGSHLIAVLFAIIIGILGAYISLTPLKHLGIRIAHLGKQPIGWIIMTIFYTFLVANMGIHFGAELFRIQHGKPNGDDTVIINVPYYPLLLILLALSVLGILITNVTTITAQNAVLMTISSYIIISGLSMIYNVLFVRFVSNESPILLEPSLFFSKDVYVSVRKNVSLAIIVILSILSTKYHTEIDLAREIVRHPHERD